MHPIAVLDLVSFLASSTALFFLFRGWRRFLSRDAKLLLTGLFSFIALYNLCLFLEWSGITEAFVTVEDFTGALVPMWWAFVFYGVLQETASQDLRESEEGYRRLVRQSKDAIFQVDLNSRITFASPATRAILGYRPEDFLSDPDLLLGIVHPDYGHQFDEFWKEYHTEGIFPERMLEWGWIHKDGHTVRTENVFTNLFDADGNLIGFQTIARDTTERKRAEEAVIQAKEDWENTFDAITDMVMLLDNEHHIIRVNKAAADALDTTKESLVHKKCYEAVHKRSKPIAKCPLLLTKKTLEPRTAEITEPHLDGTFICSTSPILNHAGEFTGYTHSLKDVTESKGLEAQLQHAQRMEAIGTLAGGIAHDFNNVLMGIQGHTSLMLLHIDSDHPHFGHITGVEDMVHRGAELTRQLLGFARGGKYEVKVTNLNELVEKSSEMFGRTRKEITVGKRYQQGIWPVEVDRTQIEQVLLNLYVNAWQAMPHGGDLHVETSNVALGLSQTKPFGVNPGNYVKVSVNDTGIGIDKATQQRIFDPFFTTKEMGRGTGLGLSSAYGIIKNHGGIIDVYSEEDKGSSFNIYLPASEKKFAVREVRLADEILKGTETILLVDDEDVVVDVGEEMLEAMGYKVLVARSGKEGVDVYIKHKEEIDLVILDMIMPDMGGGEAYDRMKEEDSDAKVILSSGYSIDGQATEILGRGCSGFIQKPFNMKDLSGKVREILEER
jgi:PAS domain S-box-containing protein